jgi:hypothetical protein
LLFTKKKIPPPTTNARRRMIPITNPLFGLFLEGARLYPLVICDGCPYTPGIPVEGEEAAGEELCLADP